MTTEYRNSLSHSAGPGRKYAIGQNFLKAVLPVASIGKNPPSVKSCFQPKCEFVFVVPLRLVAVPSPSACLLQSAVPALPVWTTVDFHCFRSVCCPHRGKSKTTRQETAETKEPILPDSFFARHVPTAASCSVYLLASSTGLYQEFQYGLAAYHIGSVKCARASIRL